MMFIAALTACLATNSGRSAWFVGVLLLMIYVIFAMMLYLVPPRESFAGAGIQTACLAERPQERDACGYLV